jgi:hypothetical protein
MNLRETGTMALVLGALLLACATYRPATGPVDWEAADSEWDVILVTEDPDGDVRETRVWLAIVDGVGTVRTGPTRWAANLKRDPQATLWAAGVAYPVRAEFVTDTSERDAIDVAFRTKYGWQDGMLRWFGRRDPEENFVRLNRRPN